MSSRVALVMCLCICMVDIHVRTHIYAYIYEIYVYTCIDMYAYIYICINTNMYVNVYTSFSVLDIINHRIRSWWKTPVFFRGLCELHRQKCQLTVILVCYICPGYRVESLCNFRTVSQWSVTGTSQRDRLWLFVGSNYRRSQKVGT